MEFLKKAGRFIVCRIKMVYLNLFRNELYKYVSCKNCKGCIRLPKNKGKLIVTCPRCGETSEIET